MSKGLQASCKFVEFSSNFCCWTQFCSSSKYQPHWFCSNRLLWKGVFKLYAQGFLLLCDFLSTFPPTAGVPLMHQDWLEYHATQGIADNSCTCARRPGALYRCIEDFDWARSGSQWLNCSLFHCYRSHECMIPDLCGQHFSGHSE